MDVRQIYWADNRMSEKVWRELKQVDKIGIPLLITFYLVFAIFDPLKFGRWFIIIMAGILIPLVLLATWSRYHFFPDAIGFTESGIYLKTAKGRTKFMLWKRISGFSKNGEYLLYSCWYLFGGNNSIRLFSEARIEAKKHWDKYYEQKERMKKDKQQQIIKQIVVVISFLIASLILSYYLISKSELFEGMFVLIWASGSMVIVIIYLAYNYTKLKKAQG